VRSALQRRSDDGGGAEGLLQGQNSSLQDTALRDVRGQLSQDCQREDSEIPFEGRDGEEGHNTD